ncbi:MAG: nicotinate phosphoribosyltransferase [Nitrospiria bacterium]
MFHIADFDDIKKGKITDVYFERSMEILRAKRINKHVRAEFIAKEFPGESEWGVLAGLEEAGEILKGLGVNVRAMPEGTVFKTNEPVMEIEGPYQSFGRFETTLLGLMCQASGIATKAARCKRKAGKKKIVSFGARRMHPALAPMIERNAFMGGCDGVAVIQSAELIEEEATGTMPHAMILLFGNMIDAAKAFDEIIDPSIKRVVLVDTFGDEKFEAIAAAEALGNKLYAIRLDTPSSRRGDFLKIIKEVRWELDVRGFQKVRIFVSGGIDEGDIERLNPWVDAYGIGTVISNAPVIDFSMDIIEVDGKPLSKRGKMSGAKQVISCQDCLMREIIPLSTSKPVHCRSCQSETEPLLLSWISSGKILSPSRKVREIRNDVLRQVQILS